MWENKPYDNYFSIIAILKIIFVKYIIYIESYNELVIHYDLM